MVYSSCVGREMSARVEYNFEIKILFFILKLYIQLNEGI